MNNKNIFYLLVISFYLIGCVQPESVISTNNGNNPPIIENILVDPLSITVGTAAVIKVTARDPDGDQLKYDWASPLGDIIGSGPEVRYTAAFCCVGVNVISVTVSDIKNAKTSKEIFIEILP
ncbi:MAG: Ig-like domain-containing protein [Ignavibacterium sp.]